MAEKKKPSGSKVSKVSQVISQARESLKLLETLEKETLAKARTFVRNPLPTVSNKSKAANERIKASLKSLGVATQSEVKELERRIETIEAELNALTAAKKTSGKAARGASSPEAFPNT